MGSHWRTLRVVQPCVLAVSPGAGIAHFAYQLRPSLALWKASRRMWVRSPPIGEWGSRKFSRLHPGWRFFGDGSDGALNVTSGTTTAAGEHWYSSVQCVSRSDFGYQRAVLADYSQHWNLAPSLVLFPAVSAIGRAAGNNSLISGWGGGTLRWKRWEVQLRV